MKKHAFSLIEVMVYLVLLLLIVLVLGQLVHHAQKSCKNLLVCTDSVLQEQLLFDMMRRDLISASIDVADWNCAQGIWQKKFIDATGRPLITSIGYVAKPQGVVRYEGVYDMSNKYWCKKAVSVLGTRVRTLQFNVECNPVTGYVTRVQISFTRLLNKEPEIFFVRLHNGEIE